MQTTQFRYCLHVLRPQVILLWLLFGSYTLPYAVAQRTSGKSINLQYYDDHFIHYGILLGVHSTRYALLYADAYGLPDYKDLHSVQGEPSTGFKVGFIINAKLFSGLDFRILPTVGLYENKLAYHMLDGTTITQLRGYALLELPLLFKIKAVRRGNSRLYLLAGITPAFEASQQKDLDKTNTLLQTEKSMTSMDIGVGWDLYRAFFKLSPEIRYSYGLNNVLSTDNNWYQLVLKDLRLHTISFYLTFEGGAY